MASNNHHLQIHTLPQPKYVDAVRFVPSPSAFHRHVAVASFDFSSDAPSLEVHSLNPDSPNPTLTHISSWAPPSRITSLRTSPRTLLVGTANGSVHFLEFPEARGLHALGGEQLVARGGNVSVHVGPVAGVDLGESGSEGVSVGEDGRVNLVRVREGGVDCERVYDSKGLVSYTAVKWASPTEFATGGLGFGMHWWDRRKPGGPATQFKGNWSRRTSGIVHSIDINPSRKHTCVAGGSSGTVFAWDLRWQQQPIILSGVGADEMHSVSESDIWEVKYDSFTHSSDKMSSARVLPVMICSEDGILAVVKQGEEPTELLAEPCAINSFDIDTHNPSDVICSLEWESIAILTRA